MTQHSGRHGHRLALWNWQVNAESATSSVIWRLIIWLNWMDLTYQVRSSWLAITSKTRDVLMRCSRSSSNLTAIVLISVISRPFHAPLSCPIKHHRLNFLKMWVSGIFHKNLPYRLSPFLSKKLFHGDFFFFTIFIYCHCCLVQIFRFSWAISFRLLLQCCYQRRWLAVCWCKFNAFLIILPVQWNVLLLLLLLFRKLRQCASHRSHGFSHRTSYWTFPRKSLVLSSCCLGDDAHTFSHIPQQNGMFKYYQY